MCQCRGHVIMRLLIWSHVASERTSSIRQLCVHSLLQSLKKGKNNSNIVLHHVVLHHVVSHHIALHHTLLHCIRLCIILHCFLYCIVLNHDVYHIMSYFIKLYRSILPHHCHIVLYSILLYQIILHHTIFYRIPLMVLYYILSEYYV